MTVYRFDRCGNIIEKESDVNGFKAGPRIRPYIDSPELVIMDLCPNCYISLMDWAELNKEEGG